MEPVASIQLKRVLVILLQRRILRRLLQHAIADHQRLDLRAHEAAEGVFWGADDRFAADVEGGVDEDGAARLFAGGLDEVVAARVGVLFAPGAVLYLNKSNGKRYPQPR